jgi:Fur family ferric uptake transcriptional regulator
MHTEPDIKQRLGQHSVNATPIRTAVLGAFFTHPQALSQYDVEELLDCQYDRTSIYRALQLFEQQGILHRVPHTESVTKYALCPPAACSHHHHAHQHLHFYCQKCENTFCLNELAIPATEFPGFGGRVLEVEILAKGICEGCVSRGA